MVKGGRRREKTENPRKVTKRLNVQDRLTNGEGRKKKKENRRLKESDKKTMYKTD